MVREQPLTSTLNNLSVYMILMKYRYQALKRSDIMNTSTRASSKWSQSVTGMKRGFGDFIQKGMRVRESNLVQLEASQGLPAYQDKKYYE